MKKIVALLFCFLFLMTACSGKEEEPSSVFDKSNALSYVGAGEMTAINILVNSNEMLSSSVFVDGHLPVDESGLIKNEQGTFAPVASVEISTYAKLEEKVYSTYTAETAEKLLNSPAKYAEINGKLYFNMKHDAPAQGEAAENPEISAEISADGKYVITVKYAGEETVMTAVETENGIRLEDIY